MHDFVEQLKDHLRGMWRFRRIAVVVAWAVCLIGWIVVLSLPPVYEASARVYVDASAVLRPLLQGIAVEQDVQAQLNYVRQAMLSRPQLERVARETDMDLKAGTPEQKEALIDELSQNIVIDNAVQGTKAKKNESSLYTISNRGPDRQKSLKVVQSLVNSFVEDTLGGKRSGSDTAQRFLRDQVAEYEKRLADAEKQLAEFKKGNLGVVPGAQGGYFNRLQSETEALQKAQADLQVASQRRAELARQLSGAKSAGAAGGSLATSDVAMRIAEAQRRLDELLLNYTDKHPDVIATRQTLVQLKARQAAEIEALKSGTASPEALAGLSSSPVFQQTQLQINQTDVEIASLRGQVGLHQQQIAQLRALADSAPEAEAEFTRLTRDYDGTKARYDELVNRLERAKISDQAEQTGVIRFEVIDPPSVRLEPVAPDRPRLLSVMLVVGLLAGAAVAFGLHSLRPVFTSARSLADISGLPVLGAVARTWVERHRAERRTELRQLAVATGALAVVFTLILFFANSGARVIQTIARWA
jgi:polysaccharide chain length determinant protein (PEP-CTERM system associated)